MRLTKSRRDGSARNAASAPNSTIRAQYRVITFANPYRESETALSIVRTPFLAVAIHITFTALPITSAGRLSPCGPLGMAYRLSMVSGPVRRE
jgi:hypothetical protein